MVKKPPNDPPDDEDEDDDDEEDEEDEEEEEDDSWTRRGRRRLRDDREIKNERPRISRKEAERVSIPPWPKIHQLDNWKMQLLMNVLSACADPDTDTWTKWLEQALGLNPDLNSLSDSGGDRFATIDIKMAMGMQNMLRQAPDEAKDVYLDATRHSELRHQQGVIVKGRELVALVMQSFRTSDRTDLVYHIKHLFNLDFKLQQSQLRFRKTQLRFHWWLLDYSDSHLCEGELTARGDHLTGSMPGKRVLAGVGGGLSLGLGTLQPSGFSSPQNVGGLDLLAPPP